jgi:wyosine [tRNA(Phe)-imidazoG37] synthetase (radical SAM superfamily)
MTTVPYHAIVYGPLKSRRLGTSLCVTPVPTPRENCASDCIYCKTGVTASIPIISRVKGTPSSGVVVTSVARRLIEMQRAGEKIESLVVTGDADPTAHGHLLEISENLRDLRNKWFPKADLALVCESLALACPELRAVCTIYDQPIFRFEWGTAKTYESFRPGATLEYKTLFERIAQIDRIMLQASFVQGALDNSSEKEVTAWIKKLEELRPREVQLTTPEGTRKGVKPISASRLEEIAAKVAERTNAATVVVTEEAQPVG